MTRAATYTGICKSKLYELWSKWEDSKGTVLPAAKVGLRNVIRKTVLNREDVGMVREYIMTCRIRSGKAVEMPQIQKWLLEEIERYECDTT